MACINCGLDSICLNACDINQVTTGRHVQLVKEAEWAWLHGGDDSNPYPSGTADHGVYNVALMAAQQAQAEHFAQVREPY